MLERLKQEPLYQDLNWRLVLIGLISSLGALGFGFDNGWWGGALGLSEFKKKYGEYDEETDSFALPSYKTSAGTGTGSAGIIIGCIIAPFVTTTLGRKKSFIVMSGLMSTGIVLEASAVTSFWQLVVGRMLVYSGIGLASNCVPMYLAECSPPKIRGLFCPRRWLSGMSILADPRDIGAFLALYSFFTSLGGFLASVVVYGSKHRSDQWQYLYAVRIDLW
jgi:MFS family permease